MNPFLYKAGTPTKSRLDLSLQKKIQSLWSTSDSHLRGLWEKERMNCSGASLSASLTDILLDLSPWTWSLLFINS